MSTTDNTLTDTHVTPYAAAKFVNEALKEAGVDKVVPSQMMYNYTKARLNANKVSFIECDLNDEGEFVGVNIEALAAWTTKYVEKKIAETYVS